MESKFILPAAITHLNISENKASEFFAKWNEVLGYAIRSP